MHGMERSNASFAFGSLWAGAASAMGTTFLSLARLEGRPTALNPCPTAACRASQAFDFVTSSDQVLIHGTQNVFHIVELWSD